MLILCFLFVTGVSVEHTVDGIPSKNTACFDGPAHFVDPLVVKGHPVRTMTDTYLAGLCIFPKVRRSAVLDTVQVSK